VLTPRRTVLLLAGFVLFAGAYLAYDRLLGWLDGLPQLPPKMLDVADGRFAPPAGNESPTLQRIKEAFGDGSAELNTSHYETQLEFRNGESSVVVAAGKVPSNPNSKRVTLSPFSIAVFSKPKPAHLRLPGEVTEISTIHADKGVLEFDRVITNPADMGRKAKLVQMELVSDFAEALPDPRRGVVHITNNQRSSDPNRFLTLRTVGPVFYRDPKAVTGAPPQGPDFWTDAPVEIVDRQNLPRPIGSAAPVTVPTKSEDARAPGAVAAMLGGQRLPPPTVTAVGLRVYLEPDPPPGQKRKEPKPGASPVNGVRRLEFLEQVVMHLWIDNGQSLVGGAPEAAPGSPAAQKSGGGFALVPPHPLIAAVAGGLAPAAYHARLMGRALLQIDTRGAFAYDAEKALARFDVIPQSDPNLLNDVQVTKVPPRAGTSSLFSQVLELEFNGSPTGGARPANAPAIKRLHAWASEPGRVVTLVSEDEAAQAYGRDLVHEQGASRTVLTGSPLRVMRDRSELTAGAAQASATLTTEPGPPVAPAPGLPPVRKQQMTVRGAGKVELFDAATNAVGLVAAWRTSLVQSKELVNGREQDLFVLTDNARFDDLKADYWLKGDLLRVWMEPRGEPGTAPKAADAKGPGGAAKPSRVLAVGHVESHSTEYDIKEADQLTVHIADAQPAAVAAAVKPPESPAGGPAPAAPKADPPAVAGLPPKASNPVAKGPERPKPPYQIRAKTIETFLTRVPTAPLPPAKPGDPPAAPGSKYQLDRARCEDNVTVHQEPLEPAKPRGVDIIGRLLLIDGSSDGSVMTVFGWPNKLGEVHQEEMSLIGPKVVLDQVRNAAAVEGRGSLTMPTNSDLSGGELARPEVVVVHWRDSMAFNGAQKSAVFVGKAQAIQGESSVQCHTLNVVFDRPMYFNPAQKREAAAKGAGEKAKIDKVLCYPAPADAADHRSELTVVYNQVDYDKDGKLLKVQQLRVQDLRMEAQAQDPDGRGGKYQRVVAEGPGTLRIWQAGEANPAGPPGGAKGPKPPAPGGKPAEKGEEMKLTVIKFTGRMTGEDKGKVYQIAKFGGDVQAISVPADSPRWRSIKATCRPARSWSPAPRSWWCGRTSRAPLPRCSTWTRSATPTCGRTSTTGRRRRSPARGRR
jgi:hypothetical protein